MAAKLQPTRKGKRLLKLIAEQRRVAGIDWADWPDGEFEYARLTHVILDIGRALVARRCRSDSSRLDRVILGCWFADFDTHGALMGDDQERFQAAGWRAALAFGGLRLSDANVSA